jgi:hypothetical protein
MGCRISGLHSFVVVFIMAHDNVSTEGHILNCISFAYDDFLVVQVHYNFRAGFAFDLLDEIVVLHLRCG